MCKLSDCGIHHCHPSARQPLFETARAGQQMIRGRPDGEWNYRFELLKPVPDICEHLPPVHENPEELMQVEHDQSVVRSFVGRFVKSFERRVSHYVQLKS